MLFGVADGGALELRREENGGVRLRGRFPYGSETSLAPGRSERFAARAFAARIDAGADIHLLSGHDYEKPLASRAAGTLTLRDTPQALELDATVTAEMANTTWARDFLLAQGAGLVRGLSPGFQVVPGGERIEQRGDGLLRTVMAADLFELSAVTVPAYRAAQIEARNWKAEREAPDMGLMRTLNRWRA
jgi:uncharacterized protein